MQALIERFKVAPLPPRFSQLHPGIKIVDPEQWRDVILADIKEGPNGARAQTGSLQNELEAFFRLPSPEEGEN